MRGSRSTVPTIALGLGTYGHPVVEPMSAFMKSVVIVGGSRTGKTRLANSIVGQQVSALGGGNLVIDYKGDEPMVKAKARLAEQEGRNFLHFTLAPKSGGKYKPAHPYAPPAPARYDPLSRGNGESKTSMLLNSVPRDGDAAAYLRSAREVAELAWNIAALTGFDRSVGSDGRTPLSSLEVLMSMLDPGEEKGEGRLYQQTRALDAEQVRDMYPHLSRQDAEARIVSLQARVASMRAELGRQNTVTAQSVVSTRQLVSSYVNSSALYPGALSTGRAPALQIDLVRAVLRGEIVVFSLPAQNYPDFSAMIGSMILLDLQNAVATLRNNVQHVAQLYGADVSVADSTPWPPFMVQIEELGTAVNSSSAEALINLLNKSADVGIRTVVSTQALADIRAVDDGQGVWLDRLLGQADHLFSLQLNTKTDDEIVCDFSGRVTKQVAAAQTAVRNNRFKLFTGAGLSTELRSSDTDQTRIPLGTTQKLNRELFQMVYVSKAPELAAVHTTAPEGPNNWHEVLEMVPVREAPYQYDPYADAEAAAASAAAAVAIARDLNEAVSERDGVLAQILDTSREKADVEPSLAVPPVVDIEVPEAFRAVADDTVSDDGWGALGDLSTEPPVDDGWDAVEPPPLDSEGAAYERF